MNTSAADKPSEPDTREPRVFECEFPGTPFPSEIGKLIGQGVKFNVRFEEILPKGK